MGKLPVLLLVFNRPNETKQVFEEIKKYQPDKLFISCDGAREKDRNNQNKVKEILSNINWNCDVKYNYSDINKGCKEAVSSGITWFFSNVKEGIILEDDCLPSKSFFAYCESLIKKYRENKKIFMISGFSPVRINIEEDYIFSKQTLVWGWATWADRWETYDIEMVKLDQIKNNLEIPNKKQRKDTYKKLLIQREKQINTWDNQLQYTLLQQKSLSIIPKKSLIQNIGFSNEATHTVLEYDVAKVKRHDLKFPLNHPKKVVHNESEDYLIYKEFKITPLKFISAVGRYLIK